MSDNRGDWPARSPANANEPSLALEFVETLVFAARTIREIAAMLVYRRDLYRSRQQLRDLSDEQLRDVGLNRRQAEIEAGRPFFD